MKEQLILRSATGKARGVPDVVFGGGGKDAEAGFGGSGDEGWCQGDDDGWRGAAAAMQEDYGVGGGFGGCAVAEGFGGAVRKGGGFIGHGDVEIPRSVDGEYLRGGLIRLRHCAIQKRSAASRLSRVYVTLWPSRAGAPGFYYE